MDDGAANSGSEVPIDHWRRYRRLMALMSGLAVVAIAGALAVFHHEGVILHRNFVIALSLGIGATTLLAGALMGLVFVSAGSGHDEAVKRYSRRGDAPDRNRRN